MDWQEFAERLAELARELLAEESLNGTLERITAAAVELVEHCDAAGIMLVHGDRVESVAPTAQVVRESDGIQHRVQEGPCYDAVQHSERVFRVPDFTRSQPRWPRYAPEARRLGLGSMMGFLLYTEDQELGALNIYSRRPGVFGRTSETAGWVLASHAAVAFASARTHVQLQQALSTRHTIGEAMGILMGSGNLTEEQAFDVLRRYSQENNVKLREVAQRVCEAGNLS
ncbi:GAF and ANTAR domain-containing protein [Streptomyces sp. WMMC500]|uniref:GAF and ANTAR domain-containing protein n=1 Tax=Streptomyces sp. WMMC500 TaxID=3015154 RepID=UPI00248B5343|nr:GAF and ANTAR domain-containing protein [Streptomyces sp. WMMC500]WBB61670.1 GAF and ANTAR domain-containing protein [Streptomyces sp. WMMC500]